MQYCVNCHGPDGHSPIPGTPDFKRGERLMQASDVMFVPAMKFGKGAMPGYQGILSDQQIFDVLAYTRMLFR